MTKIALIVAMDEERGIGRDNDLMWNLPSDMKFFKTITQGQIVVMGRKNYDSIPQKFRPLPNRLNCILSHSPQLNAPGCLVFNELSDCMQRLEGDARTIFIIGGGEIYRLAMHELSIDEMYITRIEGVFDADTFFPEFNEQDWRVSIIATQQKDENHSHNFTIFHYCRNN